MRSVDAAISKQVLHGNRLGMKIGIQEFLGFAYCMLDYRPVHAF